MNLAVKLVCGENSNFAVVLRLDLRIDCVNVHDFNFFSVPETRRGGGLSFKPGYKDKAKKVKHQNFFNKFHVRTVKFFSTVPTRRKTAISYFSEKFPQSRNKTSGDTFIGFVLNAPDMPRFCPVNEKSGRIISTQPEKSQWIKSLCVDPKELCPQQR